MLRISGITAVQNLFGLGKHGFRNGNKATGVVATKLTAEVFNSWQEEKANVIEASGRTLDPDDNKQLSKSVVKCMASGAALPTENIGPIWHPDYNSIMTWQVFNANGANYTGYASVLIGGFLLDTQPTPRTGYVKNGTPNLSRNTYAALRAWAQHNGIMVDAGVWAAGKIVVCDNPDGLTFKIYDVRGEGLRIWDDSRGVDSGRVFGSWQTGSPVSHDNTGGTTSFDTVGLGDGSVVPWADISDPWVGTYPLAMYRDSAGTLVNATAAGFINMARMRNTALAGMVKF